MYAHTHAHICTHTIYTYSHNICSIIYIHTSAFNQDLSMWDVSAVTDMGGMFSDASAFNQGLSTWDVSAVTGMGDMFSD